ncbi:hypothetical protein PsYK624_121490 [Phanerochaete sordida]|uniref:Uncharacterized protein n=1 Tax=Phanerochaete sordida TaxID=48140 RepID=A0A9P3GJJ3_9APHY|nr:hypothetical protein PsYK624_121490 [Phanerochaete sordida]
MSKPTTLQKARKPLTRLLTKAKALVNPREPSPTKTRTKRTTRAKAATNSVAPQAGPSTAPRRVTRSVSKAAASQVPDRSDDHPTGPTEQPLDAQLDDITEEADAVPSASYARSTTNIPEPNGTHRETTTQPAGDEKLAICANSHHDSSSAEHGQDATVPGALLTEALPTNEATPGASQALTTEKPMKYTVISDSASAFPYFRNAFYSKGEERDDLWFTLAVAESDGKEAIAMVFHDRSTAPSKFVPWAKDEDADCWRVRDFMHLHLDRDNRMNRIVHDLMAIRSLNDPTLREELPSEDRKHARRRQREWEAEQQRLFSLNEGYLWKQELLDGKRTTEAAANWLRARVERAFPGRKPSVISKRKGAMKFFNATLWKCDMPFWKLYPASQRRHRRVGHRPKTYEELGFPDEPEQPTKAEREEEWARRNDESSDRDATDHREGSELSMVPSTEYETKSSDFYSSDEDEDELDSDAPEAAPILGPSRGTKRARDDFEADAEYFHPQYEDPGAPGTSAHGSRKRARKETSAWVPRTTFLVPKKRSRSAANGERKPASQHDEAQADSRSPSHAPSGGAEPFDVQSWLAGLAPKRTQRAEPAAGPSHEHVAVKTEPVDDALPGFAPWPPAPPRDKGKRRATEVDECWRDEPAAHAPPQPAVKPRKRKRGVDDRAPVPDFAARASPPARPANGTGKGKARAGAPPPYARASAPSPQMPPRGMGGGGAASGRNVALDGFVVEDGPAPWRDMVAAPKRAAVPSANAKGKRRADAEFGADLVPDYVRRAGAKRYANGDQAASGGALPEDPSYGYDVYVGEGTDRAAKRRRREGES